MNLFYLQTHLSAYLKGLYFDLDDGEEIKVIFSSEKFPFNNEKFGEMVKTAKLQLLDYSDTEDAKTLIIKK